MLAGLDAEGHWWCDCPVLRQREQSSPPPPTLCPVTVADIFSRCSWQGGPHWLNYPAVPVTPTPLFTRKRARQIDGLMREVTEWDQPDSFWLKSAVLSLSVLSNRNLLKLYNSYGSWFHINDNEISLHSCLREHYILLLDKMHWVSLHLITVGHVITLICKFSFLSSQFVHLSCCQIGLSFLFSFFNTTLPLITTGKYGQAL